MKKTVSVVLAFAFCRILVAADPSRHIEIEKEIKISGATVAVERAADSRFIRYRITPQGGGKDRVLRTLKFPSFKFSETQMPDPVETAVQGTAGLQSLRPGIRLGSFGYMAFAERFSRRGIVCGWISDRKANGVVYARVSNGRVAVSPELQYGKCLVKAGAKLPTETFVIGYFDDCRKGLEALADEIVREHDIKLKKQIAGYCTWYAEEPYGWGGDEKSTRQFIDTAKRLGLEKWGFNFFQIDDYWQDGETSNGPAKNFTKVKADGPYPSGMKTTFDNIAANGYTPGIWFMPFVGTWNGEWWKDKQDLFLKTKDGKPYETSWGGTVMDMTNPKALEYLKSVTKRICGEWNCRYIKYDGMWTALGCRLGAGGRDALATDDFGENCFFDPTATGVDAYRSGVKTMREAAGEDTFILGCNLAQSMRGMGPSYGLVDAMRVGGDNGPWEERWWTGFEPSSTRYFFNGRVWYNDPDPVYVRDIRKIGKARLMASWTSVAGFFFNFSDWIGNLSEKRLDILKRTMAPHGSLNVRPVELFEKTLPNVWHLSEGGYEIYSLCNFNTKSTLKIDYAMDYVDLDPTKTYVAFDFWNNHYLGTVHSRFAFEVPKCDCRVVALREIDRTRPLLLSTSRHVASPVFDVSGETWDAQSRTLSGESKTVAGEAYELRVYVPDHFRCREAPGARFRQSGNLLRVEFADPGDKLNWKILFDEK